MEVNSRITATMKYPKVGELNLPHLRIKQLLVEELQEVKLSRG